MATYGYDDTPQLPGSPYRVHDGTRPQPRIVTPGCCGLPPSDARVLFDGTGLDEWVGREGGTVEWRLSGGTLEVVPGAGSIRTKAAFGSCQLHVEFRSPHVVKGESQGRGNSGIFLMERYEVQVLDCHQNPTYADGLTGALYGQFPPLVNACRKSGEWSAFDVLWEAPVFEGEALRRPAYITVLLKRRRPAPHLDCGATMHRRLRSTRRISPPERWRAGSWATGRLRNIWIRPLGGYDQA